MYKIIHIISYPMVSVREIKSIFLLGVALSVAIQFQYDAMKHYGSSYDFQPSIELKAEIDTWAVQYVMLYSPKVQKDAFDTTQTAFNLALRSYPFAEFFGKFEDDRFVYTREIVEKLKQAGKEDKGLYSGYPMKYNSLFIYGSGKPGYILDRNAAKKLHSCSPPSHLRIYEDVAVGYCMMLAGIVMLDMNVLLPTVRINGLQV